MNEFELKKAGQYIEQRRVLRQMVHKEWQRGAPFPRPLPPMSDDRNREWLRAVFGVQPRCVEISEFTFGVIFGSVATMLGYIILALV